MPLNSEQRVYLDHAATAPFDEELASVLASASWANANSLHAEGKEAARQLRDARARIARALGAHAPSEIIFTSGGTESINMAIKGLVAPVKGAVKTHIVVSAIEHHAVLHAADSLKGAGFKIDRLAPNAYGVIEPAALEQLLASIDATGDATSLVCVQALNNEVGSIQPVRELAKIAHEHGALFFCDAVQALGKLELDLDASGVDACAFSAHKVGAPKGVGVLYLRRGQRINTLMHGGGQEAGLRSGTSNVPGACAFAAAVEKAVEQREDAWQHAQLLKDHLVTGIRALEPAHAIRLTLAPDAPVAPHIISLLIDGLEGETVVLRCDNAGIAISSGSACSTGSLDPSHVLVALGIPKDRAYGGIRVSTGRETTSEDIDALIAALPEVLR